MKRLLVLLIATLLLGLAGCETTGVTNTPAREPVPADRTPQVRIRIAPTYPLAMRKQGITGRVTVEFIVDTGGNVLNPRIVSATNPAFEEAALNAIIKWKFIPGMKGGRTVSCVLQQALAFDLTE